MSSKHIVFHSNQLGLRGTEIALYDYAHFNETLLGNRSTILSHGRSPGNDPSAIQKFKDRFDVKFYDDRKEVDRILESVRADVFYMIKAGDNDGFLASGVPNLVHAVFPATPEHYHGEVYAYISQWLSKVCSDEHAPYVPFMVRTFPLVGNLRKELNIPESALVLGCHGGSDSFNIPFAQEVVKQAVIERQDLFFVFLNIDPFANHERIHFLPGSADMGRKAQFITTCDGMLHARDIGESFGLACAEFSISNKPVWTYALSGHKSHIDILGEKARLYSESTDLLNQILHIDRNEIRRGAWDRYSGAYSPEAVMAQFKSVFLDPVDKGKQG